MQTSNAIIQARNEQLKAAGAKAVQIAEAKYGIEMPAIKLDFEMTKNCIGFAERRNGVCTIRFNKKVIELGGVGFASLVSNTAAHEVAHILCYLMPTLGRNHDKGWKAVCKALGGTGATRACAESIPEFLATMKPKLIPYTYLSSTGNKVAISKIRHNKIQRGMGYRMADGGRINAYSMYFENR